LFCRQTLSPFLGQGLLGTQTVLEVREKILVILRVGQTLTGFFGNLGLTKKEKIQNCQFLDLKKDFKEI
jgi:hypothetical protein